MSTNCIICNSLTHPFLRKNFPQFGLGEVDYVKCEQCGFVFSQTHYDMPDAAWEALNRQWVAQYQGTDHNPEDPRWLERLENQTNIIGDVASLGLLPPGTWLDYGAGDGKLSDALKARHNLHFARYEHGSNAQRGNGYISESDLTQGAFSLVMHTAVLEHLRYRSQLDAVFGLVSENGVTCTHTLVPEHIPQDPDWFYFLSVHCSFYNNRSMQLLFEQYGYSCSIYNLASRLWFWFKQPAEEIRPIIDRANARGKGEYYHYIFAERFVDYWK